MPFAIGELDGNNNIGTEYKRQEQKILDFQQNMSGNMQLEGVETTICILGVVLTQEMRKAVF
ncbi:MAG: Uncharacterised protein [Bacteroidetes bacterium MED-G17]|nr:MAG: Uncharacterised protein [Bacteroidetes bacterium MED-G17]